jgi:hypothetical protein
MRALWIRSLLAVSLGWLLVSPASARSPEGTPGFTDALAGPDSPAFSIPFDKFGFTPKGLVRTDSVSGTGNGTDRPIVRTVSGEFLGRDFVFDIDVTIPAGSDDIAYVGFGDGLPNPSFFNEPSRAFLFRIHHLAAIQRFSIEAAVAPPWGSAKGAYTFHETLGDYATGQRFTFRIQRLGDSLTLSVPTLSVERSLSLSQYGWFLKGRNAFLFFSNTAQGATFSNAAVSYRGLITPGISPAAK